MIYIYIYINAIKSWILSTKMEMEKTWQWQKCESYDSLQHEEKHGTKQWLKWRQVMPQMSKTSKPEISWGHV